MKKTIVIGLMVNILLGSFNTYLLTSHKTYPDQNEIVTQRIRIVNQDNTTKLVFSADETETTITAFDRHQAIRYQLSISDEGSYSILFDKNEEPRVGYFIKDIDDQVVRYLDQVDEYTP